MISDSHQLSCTLLDTRPDRRGDLREGTASQDGLQTTGTSSRLFPVCVRALSGIAEQPAFLLYLVTNPDRTNNQSFDDSRYVYTDLGIYLTYQSPSLHLFGADTRAKYLHTLVTKCRELINEPNLPARHPSTLSPPLNLFQLIPPRIRSQPAQTPHPLLRARHASDPLLGISQLSRYIPTARSFRLRRAQKR